jgi:hypothetical protein
MPFKSTREDCGFFSGVGVEIFYSYNGPFHRQSASHLEVKGPSAFEEFWYFRENKIIDRKIKVIIPRILYHVWLCVELLIHCFQPRYDTAPPLARALQKRTLDGSNRKGTVESVSHPAGCAGEREYVKNSLRRKYSRQNDVKYSRQNDVRALSQGASQGHLSKYVKFLALVLRK